MHRRGIWPVPRVEACSPPRRIYQETGVTLSLFALALIFGLGIGPYTLADGSISPDIPSYLPWLVLVLVSLFVFAKQSGTVNWVLVSEIFPARIRGVAQALPWAAAGS